MKTIFINYTKPLLRGGNCRNKKDLDAKIKELEKDGWKVEYGKYDGINEGGFRYYYEAIKYETIKETECLQCKSENIIPIVYGYPSKETMRKFEEGKLELGGCCVTGNDPNFYCKNCGYKFLRRSVA